MKQTIILAIAIVLAGAMIPIGVSKYKSYDRTVDAKGLCEKEVQADKVIWPITYKIAEDDLSVLMRKIETNNQTIVDFLVQGGIDRDAISVSSPRINDKYTSSEYGNNDRQFRYLCTNTITVCTENVEAVLKIHPRQTELVKKGITTYSNEWDSNGKIQFLFEALNDIKPEMIEEATKNARQAAQKFAQDSGSELGKIKTAAQGTFSIEDRDVNTPQIKKVRVVTYVTYYLKN